MAPEDAPNNGHRHAAIEERRPGASPVARQLPLRQARSAWRMLTSSPRVSRVRANAEPIGQTAMAAAIAWLIAVLAFGPGRAFFAPVAAMIVLGVAPGRRVVRSVHVVIGIAVGVLIGEVVVAAAGTGPLQVAVAALVALALAVWLNGAPLLASQSASAAVLVVTLEPLVPGSAPTRLAGALIGGLVGLAVLALTSRDPARAAEEALAQALDGTTAAISGTARSLSEGDGRRARDAQARAAATLAALSGLPEVVERAQEAAQLGARQRDLTRLRRHTTALPGFELLGPDVVGLARAAARALELRNEVPGDVARATSLLADGTRGLGRWIRDGEGRNETRDAIRAAARTASEATAGGASMPVGALAGAVRSVAVDLLQATGVERRRAISMVRAGDLDAARARRHRVRRGDAQRAAAAPAEP